MRICRLVHPPVTRRGDSATSGTPNSQPQGRVRAQPPTFQLLPSRAPPVASTWVESALAPPPPMIPRAANKTGLDGTRGANEQVCGTEDDQDVSRGHRRGRVYRGAGRRPVARQLFAGRGHALGDDRCRLRLPVRGRSAQRKVSRRSRIAGLHDHPQLLRLAVDTGGKRHRAVEGRLPSAAVTLAVPGPEA
jgi:hypothetical protein